MESFECMHPNWKALATVHISLKRFVAEGTSTLEAGTSNNNGKKYELNNIEGSEIKKFYSEIINEDHATVGKELQPLVKSMEKKYDKFSQVVTKIPFNQAKFFRFAVENNVIGLREFDYKMGDINSTDRFGWSALMMAACEGAFDSVRILLDLGVDPNIQDKSGNNAQSLARKKSHFDILELLDKKGILEKDLIGDVSVQSVVEPFFCDICHQEFKETTRRKHQTSMVHQFSTRFSINKQTRFNIPKTNRGLQLMVKQGWDKESGLGPTNSGRLFPVKTVIRKQRSGLGIEQNSARVTHFEAFDLHATKSSYSKNKTRNRNDIRREKMGEWKRERRLRIITAAIMSKTDSQKTIEIIHSTEEVADKILANKQELINLDKRRQQTREAIREVKKNCADEKKIWTTVGSMLVKLDKEKAMQLLNNDQKQIEKEINIIRSEQKILVNKHRDLEHFSPFSGTNIKAMNHKEFAALKANLPLI